MRSTFTGKGTSDDPPGQTTFESSRRYLQRAEPIRKSIRPRAGRSPRQAVRLVGVFDEAPADRARTAQADQSGGIVWEEAGRGGREKCVCAWGGGGFL